MTSLTCIYTSKLMYKYIIKDASKWLTSNRNGGSVSPGMVAQSWPDWWLNWVRNTHIIVVLANSRVVPLRAAMETKDLVAREAALKAERCLLYVALTSAKQTATIAMETCPRS